MMAFTRTLGCVLRASGPFPGSRSASCKQVGHQTETMGTMCPQAAWPLEPCAGRALGKLHRKGHPCWRPVEVRGFYMLLCNWGFCLRGQGFLGPPGFLGFVTRPLN